MLLLLVCRHENHEDVNGKVKLSYAELAVTAKVVRNRPRSNSQQIILSTFLSKPFVRFCFILQSSSIQACLLIIEEHTFH